MINTKPNIELLELLRKGDRVAFYHIYERYCKRLYGFVLRYIKVEADADEIVQEVFVKIWESRRKIDVYSSFESYLFTIAYNTTISLLRKRANEKKYLEHLISLQDTSETPDLIDEIHYKELNEQVDRLLNELSPRQKEIYHLCRVEGLSHEEIAQKLEISLNTVKKHMSNVLSFLKSRMDNGLISSVLFAYFFLS
ncbi:RNA polymerase sigma factor [Mangrovibacterium sp.]|uniref:RNA polymerase sigma factor n=1 Tax=Mangrovibacterium sp. TaxID=1961364 RepID=UPI0035620E7D